MPAIPDITMLPDFTKVKSRANRDLLRWVQQQIPAVTPLIQGITTFRQHEGRVGTIVRTDKSEAGIEYRQSSFEFVIDRNEMRTLDLPAIYQKLMDLAKRVGADQEKQLLDLAGKAAESAGNVVHTGVEFTPDNLLELISRVPEDFDPETLQPKPGPAFVLHPETAAKILPMAKEWEQDPEFKRKLDEIRKRKLEEWRDREANRKLVG
jgi:hypothetical protein